MVQRRVDGVLVQAGAITGVGLAVTVVTDLVATVGMAAGVVLGGLRLMALLAPALLLGKTYNDTLRMING